LRGARRLRLGFGGIIDDGNEFAIGFSTATDSVLIAF
jgi:hypothetical protein